MLPLLLPPPPPNLDSILFALVFARFHHFVTFARRLGPSLRASVCLLYICRPGLIANSIPPAYRTHPSAYSYSASCHASVSSDPSHHARAPWSSLAAPVSHLAARLSCPACSHCCSAPTTIELPATHRAREKSSTPAGQTRLARKAAPHSSAANAALRVAGSHDIASWP